MIFTAETQRFGRVSPKENKISALLRVFSRRLCGEIFLPLDNWQLGLIYLLKT
jgi:hypothetical protein